MSSPGAPVRGSGLVVAKVINRGSKSERTAVELQTPDGTHRICRAHGNPLADAVLERLVGAEIRFEGRFVDGVLVLDKWSRSK